ncbi:MAG TPA: ATP-grasp domain-containing protein [Myxococcales bacterium]|jgi:D-alanine-D-alanine ligase|nr:ATP-grasp domain-containing protein [Myxococcales bacterium]
MPIKIAVLYEPSDNTGAPAPKDVRPRFREKGKAERRKRKRHPKLDRDQVADALRQNGFEPFFHELTDEAALLDLSRTKADLVFNMVEAFAGDDSKEAHVAAFLELLDLRYTGAGPRALFLAQDKAVAKKIFDFHQIRTPRFASSYRGKLDHVDDLEFPLIVKPASEDGSVGIDAGAVVHGLRELMERVSMIQEKFDCPALIEEYIEGREIYLAVLGNGKPVALPAVELDLSRLPEGMPRIAGREVKWDKGTEAYDVTGSAAAKDLEEETRRRLQETAVQVYSALQLRDYGRVDMRLTKDGRIYVIEANPNPWLSPEAELAIAAGLAGRSYVQLIGQIVELAMARYAA